MGSSLWNAEETDTLPPAVAFIVAAVALGSLVVQGLIRTFTKTQVCKTLLNESVTEFMIVVGLNALVMGFTQIGGIRYVFYVVIGIVAIMYIRDIVNARAYSSQESVTDLQESRVQAAFPRFLFTDSFRDKYIQKMSGEVKCLTAENVYQDFCGTTYRRAVFLAIGQLTLLAMFIAGLVLRGAPPFEERPAYTFYWVGILVEACYIAGKCQLQAPFINYAFFVNALRAARQGKVCVVAGGDGEMKPKEQYALVYNDYTLWVRFMLSMVTNNTGFLLIMLALPMQLSWSDEPTDFVLNAVAAFIVVDLDDLTTPVEYVVMDANKTMANSAGTKTNTSMNVEPDVIVAPAVQNRRSSPGLSSVVNKTGRSPIGSIDNQDVASLGSY